MDEKTLDKAAEDAKKINVTPKKAEVVEPIKPNIVMDYQTLKTIVEKNNFIFFDSGSYNLNFVWERTSNIFTNMFTDFLYIAYRDENGAEQLISLKATTKASLYGQGGALNPLPGGEAVIKADQYRSSWKFTMGNGSGKLPWGYPYFQQVRGINYWRDNTKDNVVDEVNEQDNKIYGTNWHIMAEPLSVNAPGRLPWSEGCLGISYSDMMNVVVPIIKKAIPIWGDIFTGTIIETFDLPMS